MPSPDRPVDAAVLRGLPSKLLAMARGSRDAAAEVEAIAARFRPKFDGLRDHAGNFRDEAAATRAQAIYRFVIDNERAVRMWSEEAETLEAAAAALLTQQEPADVAQS